MGAETPELLIAQMHDALRGVTRAGELVDVHVEQSHGSSRLLDELVESFRRRMGRVRKGGGPTQLQESQQYRRYPEGTVLAHGEFLASSVPGNLESRFKLMGLLQTKKETPPVDGDLHVERVLRAAGSRRYGRAQFDALVHAYGELPINEEISDVVVRRLCAAMTACGMPSEESCEGHGGHLPRIWFRCEEARLRTLRAALRHLRERWEVSPAGLSRVHPSEPLYVLQPKDAECEASKASERYPRAIEDLDTLGLTLFMQRGKSNNT